MVIRKDDTVASVLKADASLIEVFVGVSPAFGRLRNPALRRVMARLVTVEQAARIAGVDPDELVARLNAGAAPGPSAAVQPIRPDPDAAPGPLAAKPPALAAIPAERLVTLDVREDLRGGREPFSRIMAALQALPAGGALGVRAPFEPVPLYGVMAKRGLSHHTERFASDDWQVWFYPAGGAPAPQAPAAAPDPAASGLEGAAGITVLDVRGLEPPEPMVRTLAALESLPPGGTLVQINVRVPQFLLPRLEERGFVYEIREQAPDLVRLFIRHGRPA